MSKHTRFFSSYIDAYNYYPNGVPSTEIAIVGDSSYILVSSDNAVVGTQAFFDAGMTNDQIVDTMVDTAYVNGTTYGYSYGYPLGYTAGTTYGEAIGYANGHAAGYSEGYSYGYSYGYTEGEASAPQQYVEPDDWSQEYFTVHFGNIDTTVNNGNDIILHCGFNINTEYEWPIPNLYYSIDGGDWQAFSLYSGVCGVLIENVNKSDYYIRIKGNIQYIYENWGSDLRHLKLSNFMYVGGSSIEVPYDLEYCGNVLSLYYGDNFTSYTALPTLQPLGDGTQIFALHGLFSYDYTAQLSYPKQISSIKKLVLPQMEGRETGALFACQSQITQIPYIYNTTEADMFMVQGCSYLKYIPYLAYNWSVEDWVEEMPSYLTVIKNSNATVNGLTYSNIYDYNTTTQSALWSDDSEEFMLNVISYSILNS